MSILFFQVSTNLRNTYKTLKHTQSQVIDCKRLVLQNFCIGMHACMMLCRIQVKFYAYMSN
jgi:hypothetical protein